METLFGDSRRQCKDRPGSATHEDSGRFRTVSEMEMSMKTGQFSTFELAETLLFLNLDLVLVRVRPLYAVFETLDTEFLLTRQQMMESIEKRSLKSDDSFQGTGNTRWDEGINSNRWN
jgi:hypothetical protein